MAVFYFTLAMLALVSAALVASAAALGLIGAIVGAVEVVNLVVFGFLASVASDRHMAVHGL